MKIESISQLISQLLKAYQAMEGQRRFTVGRSSNPRIQELVKFYPGGKIIDSHEFDATALETIQNTISKNAGDVRGKNRGVLLLIQNAILLHQNKLPAERFLVIFKGAVAPELTAPVATSEPASEAGLFGRLSTMGAATLMSVADNTNFYRTCKTIFSEMFILFKSQFTDHQEAVSGLNKEFKIDIPLGQLRLDHVDKNKKEAKACVGLLDTIIKASSEAGSKPVGAKSADPISSDKIRGSVYVDNLVQTQQRIDDNARQEQLIAQLNGQLATLTAQAGDTGEDNKQQIEKLTAELSVEKADFEAAKGSMAELQGQRSKLLQQISKHADVKGQLEQRISELQETQECREQELIEACKKDIAIEQQQQAAEAANRELELRGQLLKGSAKQKQQAAAAANRLQELQGKLQQGSTKQQQQIEASASREQVLQAKLDALSAEKQTLEGKLNEFEELHKKVWLVQDDERELVRKHGPKLIDLRKAQLEFQKHHKVLLIAAAQLLGGVDSTLGVAKVGLDSCLVTYRTLCRHLEGMTSMYDELFDANSRAKFLNENVPLSLDEKVKRYSVPKDQLIMLEKQKEMLLAVKRNELDQIIVSYRSRQNMALGLPEEIDQDADDSAADEATRAKRERDANAKLLFGQCSKISELCANVAESLAKYLTDTSGESYVKQHFEGSYVKLVTDLGEFAIRNHSYIERKVSGLKETLETELRIIQAEGIPNKPRVTRVKIDMDLRPLAAQATAAEEAEQSADSSGAEASWDESEESGDENGETAARAPVAFGAR